MNPANKDNGWILCPSKSFPGKFYYFNVINGETAWSLNEAEKQFLKNPPIQKINKLHSYPEPSSPPVDITPSTIAKPTTYTSPAIVKPSVSPIYPRDIRSNIYPSNSTNDSLYQPQKYSQQTYPLNPIQIQVPMVIGSDFQNCSPNVLLILMNQTSVGNHYAIEEPKASTVPVEKLKMDADRELFVQSSNKPISQRIVHFEKPILNFNKDNKIEKPSNMLYEMSTLNKSVVPSSHNQSSVDHCQFSNINIINDRSVKNQSRPIICEPKLNWTLKQTLENSPSSNILARSPLAKRPCFQTNIDTKEPSVPTNTFASSMSAHSNIFAQSTSVHRKSFASSPHPSIVSPSLSAHTNIFAQSPTNIFTTKSSHLSKTNTFKAKQELFPPLLEEKQSKNNFQKLNNFGTNPFNTLNEKSTLAQSYSLDLKSPFKAQNVTMSAPENNYLTYCKNSNENSTFTRGHTVDNIDPNTGTDLNNLAENDLRRTLMTKKRKAMDLEQSQVIEGKKIKTEIEECPAVIPKKKVTFNLVPERFSDEIIEDHSYNDHIGYSAANTMMQESRLLASPSKSQELWYLVVDTDVLIEELEFLDNFARMNAKCRLMIPSRVMSDTAAACRGECRARPRVALARHCLTRLAVPPPHIIVQSTSEESVSNISTQGSILNFCLEGIEQDTNLILVTNDENLQSRANTLNIPCFDIQQIKQNVVKKPEVHFDIKKIKISVPNVPENISLEHEVPTHTFKNKLFDSKVETSLEDKHCNEEYKTNWKYTKDIDRDFQQLKELPRLFQEDALTNSTQVMKLPTTPNKETFKNIPNSKHSASRYFHNNGVQNLPVFEGRQNWEKEPQTVSYFFQNEAKEKNIQTISSIFKLADDKIKRKDFRKQPHSSIFEIENEQQLPHQTKSSVFEVEGIEKIRTSQVQTKPSIFDNEKYGTIQIELNNSIFGNGRTPTKEEISMKPFTFEREKYKNKENQLTCPILENQQLKNIKVQLNNSMFENNQLHTDQTPIVSSVFEIEKYKNTDVQSGPTIFDNEKYKNIEVQVNNSICENALLTIEEIPIMKIVQNNRVVQLNPPILDNETYDNNEVQLQTHIFDDEKLKNKGVQLTPSIFEIDEEMDTVLPDEIKNVFELEQSIMKIFVQNNIKEKTIEERKEEFVCIFKQIMEECLTNVLQLSSFIHTSMPPPWSLHKGLQCIAKLYGGHTTIRTIVEFLSGVLNAKGEVRVSAVAKSVGCGLLLIRYLKKLIPDAEGLTDAEDALHRFINNDTAEDMEQLVKPPVLCRSDEGSEEHSYRRNFVKERSQVLDYLKRHYPAWANYDETLDDTLLQTAWGQNYKYPKIVRTLGKNLSLLEINKSKTITMKIRNTIKNIENNKIGETTQSEKDNSQQSIIKNDDNKMKAGETTKENINIKYANDISDKQPNKCSEKFRNLINLTRKMDNKLMKTDEDIVNCVIKNENINEGANQKTDTEEIVPKIIRLFDNIKVTKQIKERSEIDCEIPIFDLDYSANGHSFGTNENAGPRVIRNVQLIDAFEAKFKNKRVSLDLDRLNYSVLSKSDDSEHISNNGNTDSNCVPMNIDDKNDIETKVGDEPNDHSHATNDKSKREIKKFYSNNDSNSQGTNNCSYSMSIDNCVTNNIVDVTNDRNDSHKEKIKKNTTINDNNFSSDYDNCLTNVASFGINDDFFIPKRTDYALNDNFETHDVVNDEFKAHKDDTTNDSGYENDSVQAYSFVKSFFYELSCSFRMVHMFIEGSIKEFQDDNLLEGKRRMLHSKANAAHVQIIEIMHKLKSIIKRESADGTTLKTLLTSAGPQASNDKRITRYRQVVTKCLEQAQMLKKALRLLMSVTDGSDDSPSVNTNSDSNVRYFNIFE